MQVNLRMSIQKFVGLPRFSGREIVGNHVDLFAARMVDGDVRQAATNSADVFRTAVLPSTSPVLVSNAAYRDSVPFRKYSKPCRSARPGESGNTGSLRSSAWIAVISSTQNTAACAGGSRYSPMMSYD